MERKTQNKLGSQHGRGDRAKPKVVPVKATTTVRKSGGVGTRQYLDAAVAPVSSSVVTSNHMHFSTTGGSRSNKAFPNRVVSVAMTDPSAVVSCSVMGMVPDEAWFFSKNENEAKLSQAHELSKFAKERLFPRWKFFTNRSQLMWTQTPNSICHYVCTSMNVRPEYRERWWHHHQENVMKELNRKRSDVSSAMKKVFLSKYSWKHRGYDTMDDSVALTLSFVCYHRLFCENRDN